MMVCNSQGEYLEAGRIRGEYGGFNKTFTGDRTGSMRYREAIKGGLQIKKYALPPGVEPGGHGGSHGYLTDEFIMSILENRRPLIDIIMSLNMTVAGVLAHQSALKDGETLKIPQFAM